MPAANCRKIVLIMTDTQRFDMLGCYGNKDLKTPHLDALAAGGMRFDRAYTCQPVCGPARAAIFTGLFPHSNGGWTNSLPLGQGIRTVGQRLQAAGVHTAYIGKWHLDGGDYFGNGVAPEGWDPSYWYEMRNYLQELSPQDRVRSRKQKSCQDPTITEEFTFGHRCSNRAVDFLSRHASEDFFLVVSYDEPHDPYLCPKKYYDMYENYEWPKKPNHWDDLKAKPSYQRVWAGDKLQWDKDKLWICLPEYFGCNTFVDCEIGRVVQAIDRYAPDAMVIYTSDHGDMIFGHSIDNKGPAMYDEITRMPFIVRWPGHAQAGAVCPNPVSHVDIVPTVLEAMGVEANAGMHGRSLLPALQDPAVRTNDAVFMEFGRYAKEIDGWGGFQPIRAAFDGRYKLAINLLSGDELYDLQADPDELVNLIDSPAHAAVRDALHDKILNWMNETSDPFRGYYWHCRPWRGDAPAPTWRYTGKSRNRRAEPEEPREIDYANGLEIE